MNGNAVGWFEIYVENMDRAKKFYQSIFETTLQKIENPEIEMWSFGGDRNSYGAPGALVKMPGFPVGRNSVLVYFSSPDCSVQEKKVIESGGKIQKSKFSIGQYGFISLVYDTEGNMFGIHSMK